MSNTNGNSKVNPGSNASSNAPSTNNNVPSGAKKGSFNVKEFIKSPTFQLGILLAVTGIVILTLFWYQYREWKKTQDDYQKKRIANVCPDYWHNVSDGENKTRVCKNVTKIGRCNIIDHIKDFGIDLYNDPIAKCKWSKYCKAPWEGISHLCADVN